MDDSEVFDRRTVRLHRDRASLRIDAVTDILAAGADLLLDRLDDVNRRFTRALDIGGRGIVAPALRARGIETVSCDLSRAMVRRAGGDIAVVADEEWLPFGENSVDLVVASLSLHWVNDLPGALIQIRRVLRPDGLLLASLPILPTLASLRVALLQAESMLTGGASPRVSPFPELRDCASLLQRAGFALPVADSDTLRLSYVDPMALVRDLRNAGETNAIRLRNRQPSSPALLPMALAALDVGEDGRVPMALEIAVMTGWAPSPDQPKPLRRGQATVRLEDALAAMPEPGDPC